MADDSPITISGGSPLTIATTEAWGPPVSGTEIKHPHGTKRVTKVYVTLPDGFTHVLDLSGGCMIAVTYGTGAGPIVVTASTKGPKGTDLHVTTSPNPFAVDYTHLDPKAYVTNVTTDSITHVVITKNGGSVLDIAPANGSVGVVIHYES